MPAAAVLLTMALAWAVAQRPAGPRDSGEGGGIQRILAIEDGRSPSGADLQWLTALARGSPEWPGAPPELRALAIRTLGRLERADLLPALIELLSRMDTRSAAETALVVTLRAQAPGVRATAAFQRAVGAALEVTTSPRVLGHLPYTASEQVAHAESRLLALGREPQRHAEVAAALEALARQHRRLHRLGAGSVEFLRRAVRRSPPGMDTAHPIPARAALAALSLSGLADEHDVRAGLRDVDDYVRRMAVVALNAEDIAIDSDARAELLRASLADKSSVVRYEGVRGWSRYAAATSGCGPLVRALDDVDPHVALAAMDTLGERCLEEESLTDRLAAEARTPPARGSWHRESHALLALARRSADRARTALPGFLDHRTWEVRMYAARAAAAMKHVPALERLAFDDHDNVREAALGPLRGLKAPASDSALAAALGRTDYQLLRTAALLLKDAARNDPLLRALVGALERVTMEGKETSRDTRIALIERIREWGGRNQLPLYERMRRDFDPEIAARAADACTALSAGPCVAAPRTPPRPPVPSPAELAERVRAVIELESGHRFEVQLAADLAPLTCTRFKRLARRGYYDGLTFHRVEPGFVVQGGSPNANEYAGDGPFMRDELGGSHRRGTVGISTRGRHTGDAQIFINLVDNLRLDFAYTVLGTVRDADMRVVDALMEGARIRRVRLVREVRRP